MDPNPNPNDENVKFSDVDDETDIFYYANVSVSPIIATTSANFPYLYSDIP